MSVPQLLVLGAGPKAMALAAKARVLADLGLPAPVIHVVERTGVGANWTGKAGYTNGRQPLGTSPEKDVGFPYNSLCWGPAVSAEVNRRMWGFAWAAFLVDHDQYSDWIDRGKPAPEHAQWARYLQWVASKAGDRLVLHHGEARALRLAGDRWRLTYEGPQGPGEAVGDGLVITGPGRVVVPAGVPEHPHVLTIESFWRSYEGLAGLERARIAIVGAGETAAAVAIGLVQLGKPGLEIEIVSPMGMAYSRGESFRENRVYSDPAQGRWAMLTPQHRRDFITRTDRGVFSVQANKLLDQADTLAVAAGRLVGLALDGDRPVLELAYDEARWTLPCDRVVLATGADSLVGLDELLDDATRAHVLAQSGLPRLGHDAVEGAIQYDMALRGLAPKLYLPMLAGLAQGPGFANLSCLGRLADRILEGAMLQGSAMPLAEATCP